MKTLAQKPYLRIAHKTIVYTLVFCIVNMPVWALDWNSGTNASFNGTDTVTVDALRSIGVWNDFDTAPGQLIQFLQNGGGALSSNHTVLNKVIGVDPTLFEGILQGGQGHIILFNPKGITVGGTAVINAGRFTATTMGLTMTDQEFLAGNSTFEFAKGTNDPSAQIALLAGSEITADQVDLLAQQINNAGTITTGTEGVVIMAAGESILLGQPGSKVIVEMTGIDGGAVTNAGTINAPEGTIVMAAGDIYSTPLHPQLQVDLDGVALTDDTYPVRVETGSGTVTQEGSITANQGSVTLTAGDEITLADGSVTSAVDGEVVTYAYDFGDTSGTTYFNDGAEIEVGTGYASIGGNHISFAGDVIADPEATLNTYSQELTIVNGAMPADPPLDTLYELMVESYSNQGINLDLAAEEMLTVEYMTDDGAITGGDGDIQLRNVFDNGGIVFEGALGERTTLETIAVANGDPSNDGGHIYMIGGTGGIVAGDLSTGKHPSDKLSNPGDILISTIEGGDIEVESMNTDGGNYSDIAAISGGNLTVHGEVVSKNHAVPKDEQTINFARICLVAQENIYVDAEGGNIEVYSHGKYGAKAEIIICAGYDVTIENVRQITASAQPSENAPDQVSTASVDISAGGNIPGNIANKATISINDIVYDPAGDNSALPISVDTNVSGTGPIGVDPSDTPTPGAPGELTWEETKIASNSVQTVTLRINNNEQVSPGHIDSPCYDCPVPPGIPPVPVIFWIVDDEFATNWRSGNVPTFDPAELDVLDNDNGIKLEAEIIPGSYTTDKGGTLVLVDMGTYYVLNYTPPTDQDFVWDGTSSDANGDYAFFIDTFTYQATKEIDGETVYSKNTANVEIVVTNYLPTLAPDSDTIHMNTSADFDLSTLVIDQDGTPGTLNYGIVEGSIPVANGSIATDSGLIPDTLTMSGNTVTYAPLDGYVSPGAAATTFGYSVTDSTMVDTQAQPVVQSESLDVTVTNTLPGGDVVLEDAPMDASGEVLGVTGGSGFSDAEDDFEILSIDPATGDYNRTYGGTLSYNGTSDPYAAGDDYTYSADTTNLPGYVGEDDFVATLWDGQRTYYADGSSAVLLTDTALGTIDLETVNERPTGDVWLGTTPMETVLDDGSIVGGAFTDDGIGNPVSVVGDGAISSDDYNVVFGGTLTNNNDGTFDYDPEMGLPGYYGDDNDTFDYGGDIAAHADDRFDVQLWDGETDYTFTQVEGEWVLDTSAPVYGEGTISVDITNESPSGEQWFGVVHMDSENNPNGWTLSNPSDPTSSVIQVANPDFGDADVVDGTYFSWLNGTLTYDSGTDSWSYTTPDIDHNPGTKDGYVGLTGDGADIPVNPGYLPDDIFTVDLSNGAFEYQFGGEQPGPEWEEYTRYNQNDFAVWRRPVYGTGVVTADIYNLKPTGSGDLGSIPLGTISLDATQVGVRDGIPLDVEDLLGVAQRGLSIDDDLLRILDIVSLSGSAGGTIAYDTASKTWTYTPAPGFVGTETFEVPLWDGEHAYTFYGVEGEYYEGFDRTPQFGSGTLTVTVTSTPPPPPTPTPVPVAPVAPLADYEVPKLVGCPVELDAAASELAVNSDQLQLLIANAMATNPNLQPCEACQNLLTAASTLQAIDMTQLAAMNQIFNSLAPIDAPFTQEISASINTAFAEFKELQPNLAEMSADQIEEYQQYANADAIVEAFVSYVAVLENDLKLPVGDSVALVMTKYGEQIEESGNPNIAAYLLDRLVSAETIADAEL